MKIAEREVGVRDGGGENCGPRVREYQRSTWLEPGPWAWCMAMVCWCLREWIAFPETREYLGLGSASDADRWGPKNPSAFSFERRARDHGQLVLPATEPARFGDPVIFDFSHIGIVIRDETEPGWLSRSRPRSARRTRDCSSISRRSTISRWSCCTGRAAG